MYDAQTQQRFNDLRAKAQAGKLTLEETKEAVALLTQGRMSAAVASTAARTTRKAASAPVPSGDDLLDEMMG